MNAVAMFVVLSILVPMMVNEWSELAPWLATRLLRWSARRLRDPKKIERYTEEWLADLERVPGKLTKLLHAVWVAICGITQLRSRGGRLTWEPAPLVSPFDSDSIFGPAGTMLQPRLSTQLPRPWPPPPTQTYAPTRSVYRCGDLCGMQCVWFHDRDQLTHALGRQLPQIEPRVAWHSVLLPRMYSSQPDLPPLSLLERFIGVMPEERYRPSYLLEPDPSGVFDTDKPTAPPVIGDLVSELELVIDGTAMSPRSGCMYSCDPPSWP